MAKEIQRADTRFRIRFLIAMTMVALLGALALLQLNDHLTELQALAEQAHPDAAAQARSTVRLVMTVILAITAMLCGYLVLTSVRVLRGQRFPPPGSRVLSDTPVRRGSAARRYGFGGLAMAVMIFLLTLFIVQRIEALFAQMLDSSLKPTLYQPPPDKDPRSGLSRRP